MRRFISAATILLLATIARAQDINFKTQEIETKLGVGYAVLLVDVDGDGKNDIVVVDQTKVVWYKNPTWERKIIIEGGTAADNVCLAAADIDGDGKIDFALGADWKPFNTKSGGTLQWLKRGKTLDEPWSIHPIDTEPTVHRIKFMDIDGSGKPALVVAPLMGRNATAKNNWADGEPVRLTAYRIPADPVKGRWTPEVLDQSMHVVHNFVPIAGPGKLPFLLAASYDGVNLIGPVIGSDGKWGRTLIGTGNQDNPKSSRGASEIKQGRLKSGKKFIATIEPWHGNQVVVYTQPTTGTMWDRHVIDDELKWGHAVSVADLDGDGSDELIIGVRDDGGKVRRGVRVYKVQDDIGAKWSRQIVDDGGVAVEDLACIDLDGDGRIDIAAVGRATHNARIYWNKGR